ncbi:hypothetical protein GCM10007425_10570 [Lysinibacillus alkalisoli]|uniref:Uncharacterized protein n=1 Tax=Lysinibacillus alkalisoli TaxID=1911548 RepID=A0A917G1N9_9BACI|nr:hypothetical protein [Lysinibacillus alkalisoli]GGG18015.1 hypothetical protein GCM10007425_10570 [Lysinibacillus alkalisoli]
MLLKNEKGTVLMLSLALLFVLTSGILWFTTLYMTQLKTYEYLEIVNVRATIKIVRQIVSERVQS